MASAGRALERRQYGTSLLSLTAEQISKLDLSDKSSLTGLVVAVPAVCMALITTVVVLRLTLRKHTMGRFLVDDYLIMLASIFTIVVCSVVIAASKYGLGKHIWNMDLGTIVEKLQICIQYMFVANIFYALAICFTKLSIVSSYIYIFDPHGPLKILMYATGAVTTGLGIASLPATIFECLPVYAAWDFTYVDAKCYTFVDFLYASTAISVATDLILCVMPIPLFWRLQLPLRQKLLISTLFFLGGFACVASIVRLAYLHLLADPIDVTHDLVSSVMWTIAECTIGIVCVSLPPLRSLLARALPNLFRTHNRSARPSDQLSPRQKPSCSGRSQGQDRDHTLWSQKTIDVVVLSSVSSKAAQTSHLSQRPPPKYAFDLSRHHSIDANDTGVSVTISAGRGRDMATTTTTMESTLAGSPTRASASMAGDQIELVSKAHRSLGSLHDSETALNAGWDKRSED